MCAHRGKIETRAECRQWGECVQADKGLVVHLLRLIAAHLHPELAEVRTSTSAVDPPTPPLSHEDPSAS